jgi:hypothetical protein
LREQIQRVKLLLPILSQDFFAAVTFSILCRFFMCSRNCPAFSFYMKILRNDATRLSALLQLSLGVKILFAKRLPYYIQLILEEHLLWGIS